MTRSLAILIAVVGSAAVILYPPYEILGNREWGFLFSSVVDMPSGMGELGRALEEPTLVYKNLDWPVLLMEIVAVNLTALVVYLLGGRK